ncbi:MAG: hypothetical protein KKF27_21270, partial [Gammaproteobacteria bacterium]|nr:hypothetical protein [Gammaproteobacteria bacterium]
LVSKTVKLEDKVYNKLMTLMHPKETYSQVVERILILFDKMGELRDVLEGQIAFREHQRSTPEWRAKTKEILGLDTNTGKDNREVKP